MIKNQIKIMVEESVEEIFRREMRKLHASILPYVSKTEQRDIETRYGKKPSQRYVRSFSL
jgi:hypothetical protein